MRNLVLSIAKFIAGGCAMGALFGGIVYLGNFGPSRLGLAIAFTLIPIVFSVISSIVPIRLVLRMWRAERRK